MDETFSLNPEAPALVIGAAGLDIVGRLRNELQLGSSSPARIRTSYGGVARNVAENLARLGQPVRLLSVVGEDQVGDQLLQKAEQAGVDVVNVLRTANKPTGSYLGILNARGVLQYALDDMRIMSSLSSKYLREKYTLFKESSMLFVDMNLSKEALRTAFSLARKAHLPVCADPTSATLAHRLLPYLQEIALVAPNSKEAEILCEGRVGGCGPNQGLDVAKFLVSQGVGIAIVTMAELGVSYATSETSGRVPAIHTEVTDPTGAGDAMSAAVLFALLNDIPVDEAVGLGVSAASLTLRYPGAVVPDLSLQKLYDQLVI
jgi:pseudouridine kinase